jgi:hypothetical protein
MWIEVDAPRQPAPRVFAERVGDGLQIGLDATRLWRGLNPAIDVELRRERGAERDFLRIGRRRRKPICGTRDAG